MRSYVERIGRKVEVRFKLNSLFWCMEYGTYGPVKNTVTRMSKTVNFTTLNDDRVSGSIELLPKTISNIVSRAKKSIRELAVNAQKSYLNHWQWPEMWKMSIWGIKNGNEDREEFRFYWIERFQQFNALSHYILSGACHPLGINYTYGIIWIV